MKGVGGRSRETRTEARSSLPVRAEDDDTLRVVLFEEGRPKISQEGGESVWSRCDGGILEGGGAVAEEKGRDVVRGAGQSDSGRHL